MTVDVSARRRRDIIDTLRRGVVPTNGLDALAVGLDRFVAALDDDIDRVAGGGSVFKAVRGEYGAGKRPVRGSCYREARSTTHSIGWPVIAAIRS